MRHVVCLLVLDLAIAGCSPAPRPDSDSKAAATPTTDPSPPTTQPDGKFARLVDMWTKGSAHLLPGRQPDHYFGDFDGDGNQDAAVLIQFSGRNASRGLVGVTVLNPWLSTVEPTASDVHETASDKALLILHGMTKEWSESTSARAFVLLDSVYDELSIVNRDSNQHLKLPPTAKGDCVLTGTEDAKGTICWDGKTYRWVQSGD